jgi:hypothetical protein
MRPIAIAFLVILVAGCAGSRRNEPFVKVDVINIQDTAPDDEEIVVRRAPRRYGRTLK